MFLRRSLTGAAQILRQEGQQQGGGAGLRVKSNLNKVLLIGTVGRDPKSIPMGENRQKVTFSVATNESYRTREGEMKYVTEWHNIAVYQDRLAQFVMGNISKGAQIYVEGTLASSKYTSKETGQEKQVYEVRINPFQGSIKILSRGAGGQPQETYVTEEGSQKNESEEFAY